MTSPHTPAPGKILVHGAEAGPVTGAAIERRARELARIRGLDHGYSATDLTAARHELLGETVPATSTDDSRAASGMNRDPSDPPSNSGRQVGGIATPDDEGVPERLALEGVEEAQHDLMLAEVNVAGSA